MDSFRDYQSARDAASALLGLGVLGVVINLAYVAVIWMSGESLLEWFAWMLGPTILFVTFLLLIFGIRFAKKAKRLRPL